MRRPIFMGASFQKRDSFVHFLQNLCYIRSRNANPNRSSGESCWPPHAYLNLFPCLKQKQEFSFCSRYQTDLTAIQPYPHAYHLVLLSSILDCQRTKRTDLRLFLG